MKKQRRDANTIFLGLQAMAYLFDGMNGIAPDRKVTQVVLRKALRATRHSDRVIRALLLKAKKRKQKVKAKPKAMTF